MTTPSEGWVSDPEVSDAAVARATERNWATWVEALDAWGARERDHATIARHVADEHGVDGWWAQAVTVGYERIRGLRKVNERPDGFSMNASKTVAVPVETLFELFVDDAGRAAWLGDGVLRVRTASAPKSARFDVAEGGVLAAHFLDKGERSAVQLTLNGLATESELAERKAQWKAPLAALAEHIAASGRYSDWQIDGSSRGRSVMALSPDTATPRSAQTGCGTSEGSLREVGPSGQRHCNLL